MVGHWQEVKVSLSLHPPLTLCLHQKISSSLRFELSLSHDYLCFGPYDVSKEHDKFKMMAKTRVPQERAE